MQTEEQLLGASKTDIDGHTYHITMLPGTRSWKLMLRITKILGPSLGKVVDTILQSVKGKKGLTGRDVMQSLMSLKLSTNFIGEVVEALCNRMEEDEVEFVINELRSVCFAGNKRMDDDTHFDAHFMGRPWAIMKWLGWALRIQYSDFSSGSANAAEQVAPSTSVPAATPPA